MINFAARFAAVCLLFAFSTAAAVPAPVAQGTRQVPLSQQRAIEAAARKELRSFGGRTPIPGVFIALYMPGYAPYVKSVGYANVPAKAPFKLSDKFRIGSNTKTFVVTILLQLQDEHKLSVDDPISKFNIGVKVPNGNHITIRQLAQMRSGLFEAYNTPQFNALKIGPQTKVAPQTLVSWATMHKPLFAPGTKWNYSNTNYVILGLIIEAVTHDTLGNQLRKRLLQPMGLSDTTLPATVAMPAPYANGYGLTPKGAWEDVTTEIPPALTWAAGAMISTVPDMKRWVKSYVTGTMNSKASQRDRFDFLPTGLGKGLDFGMGIGRNNGWYGYTGGLPGYNTAAYYMPAKDITLIAFVNAQREQPFPGAANSIIRDITRIITPNNVYFGGVPEKVMQY